MKGDLKIPKTHILNMQNCCPLIAAEWLAKVEACGDLTVPREEASKIAFKMSGMAIAALFSETPNINERKRVGKQLALLNYNQPEIISQTISTLTEQMTIGLSAEEIADFLPWLNQFLGQVTLGYIEEARRLASEQKRAASRAAVNASYIQKLTFQW